MYHRFIVVALGVPFAKPSSVTPSACLCRVNVLYLVPNQVCVNIESLSLHLTLPSFSCAVRFGIKKMLSYSIDLALSALTLR